MGCGQSTPIDSEMNLVIEDQLRQDREKMKNEVKILMLGCGESGKTTIIKQMVLIHGKGYSETERCRFKSCIFSNAIVSLRVILETMPELGITLEDDSNQEHVETIMLLPETYTHTYLSEDIAFALQELWRDRGVQGCFTRSREYQLNDSAGYYLDSVERFSDPNYIPTEQDVLRARVKTTGIQETTFQVQNLTYKMVDVGGQRSERKKWIHCFENVTTIIFMSAISEYDQTLIEDKTVNRMHEAYTLFDSICNSKWFLETAVILFLNKTDILQKKMKTSPISAFCPQYRGSNSDYDAICQFFKQQFISLNKNSEKQIYTHFTCATDTKQITFVMSAVNDIIVQANLKGCGLL